MSEVVNLDQRRLATLPHVGGDDRRSYLITLEFMDGVSTYERRIVDHEAWTFLSDGGEPPQKVIDDSEVAYPTRGDAIRALTLVGDEDAADDENVAFRKRCFAVQNSSFNGETPESDDINDFIAFVSKHGLRIEAEAFADDNY